VPRGTAFDISVVKTIKAKTTKVEGEETLAVWTPATGKRFRICGFTVFSSTETIFTLLDEAAIIYMGSVAAKTSSVVALPAQGYASTTENNKLNIKTSVEGALTVCVYGTEE
jgi:hypothetical protein